MAKSRTGKYYISINIKQILKTIAKNNQGELGLDLGIKDFLTTSKGKHIPIFSGSLCLLREHKT